MTDGAWSMPRDTYSMLSISGYLFEFWLCEGRGGKGSGAPKPHRGFRTLGWDGMSRV
jgi:hypothetical protein